MLRCPDDLGKPLKEREAGAEGREREWIDG